MFIILNIHIYSIQDWLVAIATTQLSETAQKVAENQNFIENLHNSKTKSEFCIILDRYEATCRRSLQKIVIITCSYLDSFEEISIQSKQYYR